MPVNSTSAITQWLLQSPPGEWIVNFVRGLLIGALKQGPIPKHVAFIMDGNRRYARTHRMETLEGHNLGFESLARVLEVCYRTGVKVVTVYAFSIENFKRPKHEVDGLMEMAKTKLTQLAQHGELLDRYGCRMKIIGQMDQVPADVLERVTKAVDMTKHNKDAVLNICFPYTSRAEMTHAVQATVADYCQPTSDGSTKRPFSESHIARTIQSRKLATVNEERLDDDKAHVDGEKHDDLSKESNPSLTSASSEATLTYDSRNNSPQPRSPSSSSHFPNAEDITVQTLNEHMLTAGAPPLDILVRTSGVERLSDFMLWQCHEHTSIVFLKVLWPEFDLWTFLPVLVEWQWWHQREQRAADASARDRALGKSLKVL